MSVSLKKALEWEEGLSLTPLYVRPKDAEGVSEGPLYCPRAALTKYHYPRGVDDRTSLSPSPGGCRSEVKV